MSNFFNKFLKNNESKKSEKNLVKTNKEIKNTSLLSFFKKQNFTFDDYYYGKEIDKYHIYSGDIIDFKVGKNFINEAIEILKNENISRGINFNYIGFVTFEGDEEVTKYNVRGLKVKELTINSDEGIFVKKIENNIELFHILNYYKSHLLPEFLCISNDEIRYAEVNKIDIRNLNINIVDEGFNLIKNKFLSNLKELDFGFYRDDLFGCEQVEEYFICDKEICFYNLKLIYLFVKELYKHMFTHNLDDRMNVFSMSHFNIEYFPEIKKDEILLAFLMGCNKSYLLEFEKYSKGFDERKLLKKILDINPNNYKYFLEKYQKDIEIVEYMIEHHIEFLSLLIKYGPYEKRDWTNACLNVLILDK